MSGVFVAPIALLFLGLVLPLPDDSLFPRVFFRPHMYISYALFKAGASPELVGAGGHIAALTTLGVFVVYVIPALICIVVALCLRPRNSNEAHTD